MQVNCTLFGLDYVTSVGVKASHQLCCPKGKQSASIRSTGVYGVCELLTIDLLLILLASFFNYILPSRFHLVTLLTLIRVSEVF